MNTLEAAHTYLEEQGFGVRRRLWAMGDTLQVVANLTPPIPPFTAGPNPPNPFRLLWIHQHEEGWRVVRADYIPTSTVHTFATLWEAVQDAEAWLKGVWNNL